MNKENVCEQLSDRLVELFKEPKNDVFMKYVYQRRLKGASPREVEEYIQSIKQVLMRRTGNPLDRNQLKSYVDGLLYGKETDLTKTVSFDHFKEQSKMKMHINNINLQDNLISAENISNVENRPKDEEFQAIFNEYDIMDKGAVSVNDIYFILIEISQKHPNSLYVSSYKRFQDYMENNYSTDKDINFQQGCVHW